MIVYDGSQSASDGSLLPYLLWVGGRGEREGEGKVWGEEVAGKKLPVAKV